ncbi:hypothetical protein [Sulfurisphaera ohwakuensis]|uniref:hypothetical protein n=1 Tax=Sulfurisphaera ohwakuensis TaxID=69656 RepID=UPI0036F1CBA2
MINEIEQKINSGINKVYIEVIGSFDDNEVKALVVYYKDGHIVGSDEFKVNFADSGVNKLVDFWYVNTNAFLDFWFRNNRFGTAEVDLELKLYRKAPEDNLSRIINKLKVIR